MKCNKKGLGFLTAIKIVESMKIIFILLVGISMLYLVVSPTSVPQNLKTELKEDLYTNALLSNPDCFAYNNSFNRVYQRVVDEKKLTSKRMDLCIYVPKPDNQKTTEILPAKAFFLTLNTSINSTSWPNTTSKASKYESIFVKNSTGFYPETLSINMYEVNYD